jgi:hypothetical protein
LIQLAAAFVHLSRHQYPGTVRLLDAALEKLADFPNDYMGIDVGQLTTEATQARDELTALGPERFELWDHSRIPSVRLLDGQHRRQPP